jgi:hypothetical protein
LLLTLAFDAVLNLALIAQGEEVETIVALDARKNHFFIMHTDPKCGPQKSVFYVSNTICFVTTFFPKRPPGILSPFSTIQRIFTFKPAIFYVSIPVPFNAAFTIDDVISHSKYSCLQPR